MNDQKLQEAINLKKTIGELKEHLSHKTFDDSAIGIRIRLESQIGTSKPESWLLPRFLQIDPDVIKQMYVARVKSEIAKLEKEFAEL